MEKSHARAGPSPNIRRLSSGRWSGFNVETKWGQHVRFRGGERDDVAEALMRRAVSDKPTQTTASPFNVETASPE